MKKKEIIRVRWAQQHFRRVSHTRTRTTIKHQNSGFVIRGVTSYTICFITGTYRKYVYGNILSLCDAAYWLYSPSSIYNEMSQGGLFFDVHSIPDLIWSTFLQPPTTSAEDVSAENRHIDQSHLQLGLAKSDDICWLVIHSFHVPYPPMTTPTTPWEQLDLRDEDFQIPLPLPQHEARELREKLGQLEAKPITTRWWQRESVEGYFKPVFGL